MDYETKPKPPMLTKNYQTYLDNISLICKNNNYQYEEIGQTQNKEIIKITINDDLTDTICIAAGLHGNEEAGPYAIAQFLQNNEILPDYRFIIYPLINPIGYEHNTRFTTHKKDINRGFNGGTPTHESEILKQSIAEEQQIQYFISLHEDKSSDGIYLYYSDIHNTEAYQTILNECSKILPISKRNKIYGDKCQNGMIKHTEMGTKDKNLKTLEYMLYQQGANYICFETPGKADMYLRTSCHQSMMAYILNNTDKYIHARNHRI